MSKKKEEEEEEKLLENLHARVNLGRNFTHSRRGWGDSLSVCQFQKFARLGAYARRVPSL
jgi:hypothetical protein